MTDPRPQPLSTEDGADDGADDSTINIQVWVLCTSHGDPTLRQYLIECTKDEYDDGEHYAAACSRAEGEGYEKPVAFDQNDAAGRHILELSSPSAVLISAPAVASTPASVPPPNEVSDIVKTVVQVTVLHEKIFNINEYSLQHIANEIEDGDWLGQMSIVSAEPVPRGKLRDEQLTIGGDGDFFPAEGEPGEADQGALFETIRPTRTQS